MYGVIKILVMMNQTWRLSASVVGVCHCISINWLCIAHTTHWYQFGSRSNLYHYKKIRNYLCLRSMSRDIVIRGNLAMVQLKMVLKILLYWKMVFSIVFSQKSFNLIISSAYTLFIHCHRG